MSSGQEESDIVSRISSSEVFQNIEENLPEIISFLERDTCGNEFGAVLHTLLRNGFKYCEIHSLQSVLLSDVLSSLRKIFTDCLESIKFNLETASTDSPADAEFSLNQLLKVNLDVLEGYSVLLTELSSLQEPVDANLFDSVPKTLISITSDAFRHCRDSESEYGTFFASCSSRLTALFRKSFEVQSCMLKVLDEKFIFKSHSEDDICLVLLVLEKMIEISEILCGFELTANVEQWKSFVKMASKYCECLRNRLDLTRAFACLTSTLHIILTSLSNQRDETDGAGSYLNRQLKLGNFVLKVLIKLCELYCGHLSQRSLQLLLELLINLHGRDRQLCEDTEQSHLFRSYITVGASPLLSHLITDTIFVQEWETVFSETGLKGLKSDCRLGSFSLCAHLCKKLVAARSELQQLWINHAFIPSVVNIIEHCSEEVKVVAGGLEAREGYSILVAGVAVLMTSLLNAEDFQKIEKHLFYSFCCGNFFAKLFIQDLLCLLARLTNEGLVVSWLDWLKSVRKCAGTSLYEPLLVHVRCLETRLLAFVSPRVRKSRASSPPALSLSHLVNDPPSQPTPDNFNNIVESVERVTSEEGVCLDSVVTLWRCLEAARPCLDTSVTGTRLTCSKSTLWWNRLLSGLTLATSNTLYQYQDLNFIFDIMQRLLEDNDSCVKLSIIDLIRFFILHPVSFRSESLSLIACQILLSSFRDPEPLVKSISLEVLGELNKIDFHHHNLNTVIANNNDISASISDYINGSYAVRSLINSQDMFSQGISRTDFIHKCSNVILPFAGNETEPPAKKVKTSCREINELIAKSKLLQTEMKRCLQKICDEEGLSESQKFLLTDLIAQYQTLTSYL